MKLYLPKDWNLALKELVATQNFEQLELFVEKAYATKKCYPALNQIFSAFEHSSFEDTKVVILGQDPYHGAHQATGMAFSVPLGIKHPPSLVNILRELEKDQNTSYPISGELNAWANQGVLLLNAALSVEEAAPGSHLKEWRFFTDAVIKTLSTQKKGLVFMLWGGFAHKKAKLIDEQKHCVLKTGHPSPLSANKGHWFGNGHFSKANHYLIQQGVTPIDWKL